MVSSNYNATKIGFVLSSEPPVAPDSSMPSGMPDPDGMVSVPVAALNAAESYIRALESKIAELSLRG